MSEPAKQPQQLDPAVLEQLAAQSNRVTNEELILAAMFGKQLQSDINTIKKQSAEVRGSLKVTDVDMSKVMPSHILPAMGIKAPKQAAPIPQIPVIPAQVPHIPAEVPSYNGPATHEHIQLPQVAWNTSPSQPVHDFNQLEFSFDKKARYEDIMEAIDKLEDRVILLTTKIDSVIETLDKKKLKKNDGTQTG